MPAAPVPLWRRRLDAWLEALELERGLSPRTASAYRSDLLRLAAWLEGEKQGDLLTASPDAIAAHLRWLARKEISPRSTRRAIAAMRGFYGEMVAGGERADDPSANVEAPKLWTRLPKVLSEDEVRSRLPNGSLTVGALSSDSTSSSVSDFGSERPIFGIAICAVGSSLINPSRIR